MGIYTQLLEDLSLRHGLRACASACRTWLILLPPGSGGEGASGEGMEDGGGSVELMIALHFGSRDAGEGAEGVRHDVGVWLCRQQQGHLDPESVLANNAGDGVARKWVRSVIIDICHWMWGLCF